MFLWHRRLAWLMALPVLCWALSGMLHPMMSNWFRPEIKNRFLPAKEITLPAASIPLHTLCKDFEKIHMLKLVSLKNKASLLVITPDQQLHFLDPKTGKKTNNAEKIYAEQLARSYLGDTSSPLLQIEKIEKFGGTYSYINRFLPVYRVILKREDGLQAMVDLRTGKLASYDDPFRRVTTQLFRHMHTWAFLGERDSLFRICVISTMSAMSLFLAISGLYILIKNKKRKRAKTSRKWHRLSGAVAILFYFMFTLSGLFHSLLKINYDDSDSWVSKQSIAVNTLTQSLQNIVTAAEKETNQAISPLKKVKEISLAQLGKNAYLRITLAKSKKKKSKNTIVYIHSQTLESLQNGDEIYARSLTLEFSQYQENEITGIEKITRFRNDYGFIFRRLPVWRVKFAGKPYWQYTVDVRDAHMSMRTSTPGLIEALSFINLHKFHFLDFAGKTTRDVTLILLMLLFSFLTLTGVKLMLKKKRQK